MGTPVEERPPLPLRLTWVQPEDLIGHELRQAAEDGRDASAVERTWLAAGGSPAPRSGPERRRHRPAPGCGGSRCSCSTNSPCSPARRRPTNRPAWPASKPPARTGRHPHPHRRASRRTVCGTGWKPRGWAGPPAACWGSRSRRCPSRASARSPAPPADGRWTTGSRRPACHRTSPHASPGTGAARPRPSPRTSTACPRTTTSTTPFSHCCCSSVTATASAPGTWPALAGRAARRTYLHRRARRLPQPPGRPGAPAHRLAPQPVPRVDRSADPQPTSSAGRTPATRPSAAELAWRDATLSHTANGVLRCACSSPPSPRRPRAARATSTTACAPGSKSCRHTRASPVPCASGSRRRGRNRRAPPPVSTPSSTGSTRSTGTTTGSTSCPTRRCSPPP